MDKAPIYSNKLHLSYCRFLERQFGKKVLEEVYLEAGVDEATFSDLNGFQPADTLIRMRAAAKRITGRQDIAYLAGRSMKDNLGVLTGFLAGITSPDVVMKLLGKVEGSMALKTISDVTPLGGRKYRVETHFRDDFKETRDACDNRIGSYESVPRFFGLPYAMVEHPECAFKGAPHCVYLVTMPEYGFIWFRRLAILSVPVFILILAACLFGLGAHWGSPTGFLAGAAVAVGIAGLVSISVFNHLNARKSLEWNAYINQGLSDQNRDLEETNFEIQSLQELTLLLSQTVKVQEICDKVVKTLVKDFRYGSSQIWMLSDHKKWLGCRSALGYSGNLLAFIMNTRFEMGRDWDNPYGLLVQTLEQKKTLLVNDVEDTIRKLSERTQEFIRTLDPSSFIITPLFDQDVPVGILSAENHGGRKLDQKDRLLFQSISNIVASALVKAELFESLEQKVEERSRQLERAGQELLKAREMAIQAEKLSSLGQMAAGVAHEINNPLNFLVNILPDVHRDVQGLAKIKDLAQASGDAALADAVRGLENQYDLVSHLAETDFVFERIKKALDKSTRIANSLKVFSRTSAKEAITRESLAQLVREVIDLIPQKVLGETVVEVSVPADLMWNVNKNEIEQAFLALTNNAIDAMQQKGRVRVSAEDKPGEIVMAFTDEGPGIPANALKKIFDPFYTTKPPGKGTGLGLTIASEIVRKYGGQLSVESQVGHGATFFIRFQKDGTHKA